MKRQARHGWTFFYRPGKAVYSELEWIVMRLILAWVVFSSFQAAGYDALNWSGSVGRGFHGVSTPRGIAQFVDVTWISHPANAPMIAGTVAVSLALLVLGTLPLLSSLVLFVLHVYVGTLENSQGHNVYHTSQIVCFGLLGIILGSVYDLAQTVRRHGIRGWLRMSTLRWQWLPHLTRHPAALVRRGANHLEQTLEQGRSRTIFTVQQLIATAYVVSGISKMWITSGGWMSEVKNIGIQFVKNQRNEYYETLAPPPTVPWAVDFALHHPTVASGFFSIGLWLEILCFAALLNRACLAIFGIALILMHHFIAQFMALYFAYNQWLLLAFFVNVPFWLIRGVRTRGPAASRPSQP
ncbi:MAG: hypothetical protein KA004_09530 [Verrucomicrobiales bacterium]|nr:hypothetical protein [Verrucomicrobiales bacterium]